MTSCTQCGATIDGATRIDCPVCGASLLMASLDLPRDPRAPADVGHELGETYRVALAEAPARPDPTTHRSTIVRRFDLGGRCRPQSVVLDGETILVLSIEEGDSLAIRRYALDGDSLGVVGTFRIGDGPGEIGDPAGMALDDAGNLYLLDGDGCSVVKIGADGTPSTTFGPNGLGYPRDLEVAGDGAMLLADTGNHRIVRWDPDGRLALTIGPELEEEGDERGSSGAGPGQFDTPSGVTMDSDGTIYVADTNNHRIQIFAADGGFVREFGCEGKTAGHLLFPTDIRIGRSGDVFVFDAHGRRVQKFRPDGTLVYGIAVGSSALGLRSIAGDIDVGPDEHVYVPLPAEGIVLCLRVEE